MIFSTKQYIFSPTKILHWFQLHAIILKQTQALLFLRANQCYRYLKEIGFGIILVALFVLTGFIFQALQAVLETPTIWAPVFAAFVLIIIEIRRKDSFFLKSIFDQEIDLMRFKFIENVLITFPILIFQSVFLNWQVIILILIVCGVMTVLPFHLIKTQENERKKDFKFLPLSIFEIKFYLEKKYWSILFIWMLLFLGAWHISLWIVGIVFLCVMPVEIYAPLESREMLSYTPNFVFQKIWRSAGFFMLAALPPSILILILNPAYALVLSYGIVALLLSLTLAISKKYVSYYGVNKSVPTTTSTVILTFIMLAPGGILITLSACIYYYIQAEKHMKNNYAII